MNAVERFWSKVDKRSDEECWRWLGSQAGKNYKNGNGYGQFPIKRNRNIGAHRMSAMLKYGMFHKSTVVMHTCDNPPCVNPNHLRLGTHKMNMEDMVAKGRKSYLFGEENPNAVLTDKQVEEIRNRYVKGNRWRPSNREELAKEYGISKHYVRTLVVPSSQRRNRSA